MAAMHDLDSASLGAVLKTALDAVVVMRMDGVVAGWNDVAERTFGWSYVDAFGHRMSALIIPERFRAAHEQGLAHYLATGEGPVLDKHIEIDALHRDGHELPVELSITRTEQFGEPVFLGFIRDISERRKAERRQELMIGELNHRVRNMLSVVAGIAHQTARNSETVVGFIDAFGGRLASLGHAHEVLTDASWERAPLRSLITELLGPYLADAEPQVTISGPDVLLAPRALINLSMIVHELLTNAVKYGALSRPEGRISLNWTTDGDDLAFAWIETGLIHVIAPTRKGFGSKMIARTVAHELRGRETVTWRPDGMALNLTFPLNEQPS
jgi:PAS domain S-box-containing protein